MEDTNIVQQPSFADFVNSTLREIETTIDHSQKEICKKVVAEAVKEAEDLNEKISNFKEESHQEIRINLKRKLALITGEGTSNIDPFERQSKLISQKAILLNFRSIIGPPVHKKIIRTPNTQKPFEVFIKWPKLMWDVTFPSTTVVFYTKSEEISDLFGEFKEKRFWAGSYAVLVPNMAIKYREKQEGFRVQFLYHVYNQSHILRWPVTDIQVALPKSQSKHSHTYPLSSPPLLSTSSLPHHQPPTITTTTTTTTTTTILPTTTTITIAFSLHRSSIFWISHTSTNTNTNTHTGHTNTTKLTRNQQRIHHAVV
eukprot:TRINITY_DN685_c0_g1_i1.p1 TRINITY_DN685_c0_g1~~TRINITY_DN685_c0_g1_i1.p1  ORF type:complete len:313 (-),score=72.26 TRINITY_DN685_c0_g1_i1:531-1469(-)